MALTLASSGDGRAAAIRDHLLPLVRGQGTLRIQSDHLRLVALRTEPWVFEHWTPFNELATAEAASPAIVMPSNGSTRSRTCHMVSTYGV